MDRCLFSDGTPGFVGIEFGHRFCELNGVLAEVLLVHHSALVDDEGHDARVTVLLRIGDEGEAPSHLAIYDVILRAALGSRTLFGENAIEVPMNCLLYTSDAADEEDSVD